MLELVTMSTKELDRLGVIRRVLEGSLPQITAAAMLGLTDRQVRRLCRSYEGSGAAGLVSKRRGKPGNRKARLDDREAALALVRERYVDFGPTLAAEKLRELHGLSVSREALRRWMHGAGLWKTRKDRAPAPHQPRSRRDCLGELVQIDGCEHDWFEGRGPYCSLLVFVDDATGQLMELRFVKTESAFGYFQATRSYLGRHGKPVAFYSDKHSIFRVNREGSLGTHRGVSQFARALAELNIDIICANTPQAKGRVERMNLTLQDRLVKELRLRAISTMDAGNDFLPSYMSDFNQRFGRPARAAFNAHRPLLPTEDLDEVFSWREVRTMTGNLVVNYERDTYLVTPGPDTKGLAGRRRRIEVRKWPDGRVELRHDGRTLPYTICDNYPYVTPGDIVEKKRIAEVIAQIQTAQSDGYRTSAAAKRIAIRVEPDARLRPAAPKRFPPKRAKREEPAATAPLPTTPRSREVNRHYFIRWEGELAFLFETTSLPVGRKKSATKAAELRLGQVDTQVAQLWEARGNQLDPPPLAGALVPDVARERAAEAAKHGGGLNRLSAALWFADTFHAAETQRMKEINDAADDLTRWSSDLADDVRSRGVG